MSATPDDFWATMQEILNKSSIISRPHKLKEMMDSWLMRDNYPIVKVTRNYETREVCISQIYFTKSGRNPLPGNWQIPITYATQSNLDFSRTVPYHWLKRDKESILIFSLDQDDWIIVNVQQIGMYIYTELHYLASYYM